jgi:hypothetical protein
LSKNNLELDSKAHQTLEFVEVMLPLFIWFGLSTRLSTLHVLGHIMKAASLLQIPAFDELLSLVLNCFWTIM